MNDEATPVIPIDEVERQDEARARCTAAGAANLAKWKAANPGLSSFKHGAYSRSPGSKYLDRRTREGKKLDAVITAMTDDLGGPASINSGQQLILAGLRSKIAVLWQISDWVDQQETIINPDGDLLRVLSRNFLAYSESIRRDLEVLFAINRRKQGKIPTLEEVIARSKECAE